jgi:hypothetical protein
MADEKPNIDAVLTEEQKLAAELESLKNAAPQGTPPAEAAAAEPVPAEPEPQPKPEPTPEPNPEAKVETDEEKEARTKGRAFQLLRQREKELAEARAELARRQAAATEPAKEPSFEDAPADYLKKKIEATEAELRQVRAEEQRRNYIDGIKAQEVVFAKDHPDYFKATDYLIDKDTKQWVRSGLSTRDTNIVINTVREYERTQNPQYKPWYDAVRGRVNDPGVIATAEKEGRDLEEMAAFVVARDTWLTTRRDLLAEGAKAEGRSVAEVAYEEAVDRGWSANEKGASKNEQAALQRVRQAKEVATASQSLSDSATAEPTPEVRVLRNRQQIMDLDEKSLDELIKSGAYKEL